PLASEPAVSSEGASALGAHLAEMDKLLRDVQIGLVPGREPAPLLTTIPEPPLAAAATVPAPPATEGPQIQVLSDLSARLIASIRELLAGYERVLAPSASARPPARRAARHRPDSPDVTLSAAPFASLEALREFERAVSGLPGVREVLIRGYEGTDRAIIEVRLDQPNP
ncbi:MAG TPA: hypothetical protein VJ741_13035, partial [Solirubrobacteraceae bacterium]|nr:hypothetical protein [Solirubrobacteraceae bacterium]